MEHENKVASRELDDWVGSTTAAADYVNASRCQRLVESLGLEAVDLSAGAPLPILWHWLYFLEGTDRARTGPDGHAVRGGFLPPVELHRRMFAGGRTEIHAPLEVGMQVSRTSTVEQVERKKGSSGDLVVVVVRHRISSGPELLVEERQDLLFTDAPPTTSVSGQKQVDVAPLSRDVETDEILLFRFSALTFNSHRIHYDRTYAQSQEGYPDLVVHGPLTAICVADLARVSSSAPIKWFEFRARAPIYVGETIRVRGHETDDAIQLKAYRDDGTCVVTASAGSESEL